MYVEDLLLDLASRLQAEADGDPFSRALVNDEWTRNFIINVGEYAKKDRPLSTEQGRIFLKVVNRLRTTLSVIGYADWNINRLLTSPVYKNEPYPSSNIPKQVRYLGDNKLGFRFKMNDLIIKAIHKIQPRHVQKTRGQPPVAYFDRWQRLWVVSVERKTLKPIIDIISEFRFEFDDAVADYLTLASNSQGQPSTFALDTESNSIVVNVCDNEYVANWLEHVIYADYV